MLEYPLEQGEKAHKLVKRCNDCKTFSPDASAFCTSCGASFGVRYCQRLHPNQPNAEYCAQCGSRQLSRPHPLPISATVGIVVWAVTAVGATGGAIWAAVTALQSIPEPGHLKTLLVIVVAGAAVLAKPRAGRKIRK